MVSYPMNPKYINAIFAHIGKEFLVPNLESLDRSQYNECTKLIRAISNNIIIPGLIFKTNLTPSQIHDWWNRFGAECYPQWQSVSLARSDFYTIESLTLPYKRVIEQFNVVDLHDLLLFRSKDEEFLFTDIRTYPHDIQRRLLDVLFYRDGDNPEYLYNFFEESLKIHPNVLIETVAHHLMRCIKKMQYEHIDTYLKLFDPNCEIADLYPELTTGEYFLSIGLPFHGNVGMNQFTILSLLQKEEDQLDTISEERFNHYISYLKLLLEHGNARVKDEVREMINFVRRAYPEQTEDLAYETPFTADEASFFH